MPHLTEFLQWVNEDVGGDIDHIEDEYYGRTMKDSLTRHYVQDRQKGGVRMSNLGKPAVLLALAKLGYVEPEPRGKSRFIFHVGDMFENWLEVMMRAYGIDILELQPTLTHMGITGHADYIIKCPHCDVPLLLEAKTMSANYFRQFSREPNEDRGYITQLAMYQAATGLDCAWMCLDKGNNTVFEVTPNFGQFQAALHRAQKVIDRVSKVQSEDDVLSLFRPPPPRPEVFQKVPTGDYILPTALSFSPFRHALYKLSTRNNNYNKMTTYVDDYADTQYMKEQLDKLVQEGVIYKNV
jgi:hypothetical protein